MSKFKQEKMDQAESDLIAQFLKKWVNDKDEDSALQVISLATNYLPASEIGKEIDDLIELKAHLDYITVVYEAKKEAGEPIKLTRKNLYKARLEFRQGLYRYLNFSFRILKKLGFTKREISFDDLQEDDEVIEDASVSESHRNDAPNL